MKTNECIEIVPKENKFSQTETEYAKANFETDRCLKILTRDDGLLHTANALAELKNKGVQQEALANLGVTEKLETIDSSIQNTNEQLTLSIQNLRNQINSSVQNLREQIDNFNEIIIQLSQDQEINLNTLLQNYYTKGEIDQSGFLVQQEGNNGYYTRGEIENNYYDKRYINNSFYTKREVDSKISTTSANKYLTKAQADLFYQPIGRYLTEEQGNSRYQPLGDYITNQDILQLATKDELSLKANAQDVYTKGEINEMIQQTNPELDFHHSVLTQEQYDALETKDDNTIYLILESETISNSWQFGDNFPIILS